MYHHKNNNNNNNNKSSSREPSRTFHSFQLAGSAPSVLPNFNFSKRDIIFGSSTRSKSLIFNPNRVRTLNRPEHGPTTTQVGLGVVGDLARAPTITNKNLLLRPLVTTHLPFIHPRAQIIRSAQPDGSNSSVPNGENFGDLHQASNININRSSRTRMSSNRVLVDEDSIEQTNSPRKKAKRSESSDVEESFVVLKNDESPLYPTSAFMKHCFGCEKKLKHTENIYIYRGEMAFCSMECREREVFIQEKMKKRIDQTLSSTSRMITRKPTFRDFCDG